MQARNCSERVLRLKKWRVDNVKTVEQCVALCGNFPSESTIKNVFAKDSEKKTFRESTIAAIELSVLGEVYMPEISIPVKDVIKAQEDAANTFAEETKKQNILIEQQKADVRVHQYVIAVFFFYNLFILVYDRFLEIGGFYNDNTFLVWAAQVCFVVSIAFVYTVYFFRKKARLKELMSFEENK